MKRPLSFVAPAEKPMRESMVKPLHRDDGFMWSCLIFLGTILIHTTTCFKCPPELVQFLCDSDCLLDGVFKPKRSNYSMCWDVNPGRAFHIVQGLLKHLVLVICAPVHTVIATDMSIEPEARLVSEPNIIKEVRIFFNIVLEPLGTSLNVFPCQLVWVYTWPRFYMGTAKDPSLRFFATMHVKDQVLGNICRGTF